MGGEREPRAGARTGQRHDQVSRLSRQRDFLVGRVETNRGSGDAHLPQLVADRGGDGRLLTAEPLHGQETHQVLFGGFHVDRRRDLAHRTFLSAIRAVRI
jgi:hypothetical protein